MCILYDEVFTAAPTRIIKISFLPSVKCVMRYFRRLVWRALFCSRALGQVSELQRQDMVDLGSLILALACRHPVTAASRGESLAFTAQHYTPELHNLAASLVSKKPPSVFEVRAVVVSILS